MGKAFGKGLGVTKIYNIRFLLRLNIYKLNQLGLAFKGVICDFALLESTLCFFDRNNFLTLW